MLIWPLRCSLSLCFCWQHPCFVSTRARHWNENFHCIYWFPLESSRKHKERPLAISREVCYSNLQLFWVLTGAKENKLMPCPPKTLVHSQTIGEQGQRMCEVWTSKRAVQCEVWISAKLCGVHRTGAAAGMRMAASSCAGGLCPIQVSGVDCGW